MYTFFLLTRYTLKLLIDTDFIWRNQWETVSTISEELIESSSENTSKDQYNEKGKNCFKEGSREESNQTDGFNNRKSILQSYLGLVAMWVELEKKKRKSH